MFALLRELNIDVVKRRTEEPSERSCDLLLSIQSAHSDDIANKLHRLRCPSISLLCTILCQTLYYTFSLAVHEIEKTIPDRGEMCINDRSHSFFDGLLTQVCPVVCQILTTQEALLFFKIVSNLDEVG